MNTTTPAGEVIGTVTFAETSGPVTEHHTSYAADHRTYRVLPGVYEARLTREGTANAMVEFTVDIEVMTETLYSGVGGRNYAADRDDTVRTTTRTHSFYAFIAARLACQDTPELAGGAFRLAEGWSIVTTHSTFKPMPWENEGRHSTRHAFVKV